MHRQSYQIANKADSRKIAEFLSKDGQLLLPFLELICNTEQAVDELIDVAGKAAIEAVLLLSAQQLAGPKQPGKSHGEITWHGRQHGVVQCLAELFDFAGPFRIPVGTRLTVLSHDRENILEANGCHVLAGQQEFFLGSC